MPVAASWSSPRTSWPSRSRATSCWPRCGRFSTVDSRPLFASARDGRHTEPMRHSIRTRALAALAAVVTTVAGFAAGQPASSSSRLAIGVLRNDGLLLPFAAFDGRKWSAPWPSIMDGLIPELPVSLASVPRGWWGGEPPGAWKVWARNAETSRPITLQTPVMMRVGATRQLGFRTDYPPVLPLVLPFELPFPKVGIAIAGEA